jgi:hypothetical protein
LRFKPGFTCSKYSFTALIRNHVVSDSCSASRQIYLTQVYCLLALIYSCSIIRISEGDVQLERLMASSELLLTFHCRLSIVVYKLLKKHSTAFKAFVSQIENRMEFTVGL